MSLSIHARPAPSTGTSLPEIFCWTKMGAESGQALDEIVRRKELERQCGAGVFAWGIGNAVGPATERARAATGGDPLEVLFTRMKVAPKRIDVAPAAVVMWLGYQSVAGEVVPLPAHMLVTSRAHSPRGDDLGRHYALICGAERPLPGQRLREGIDGRAVSNLVSAKPVGASQGTSVVRFDAARFREIDYPVLFRARLASPGCVRLAHPVTLTGELFGPYRAVCTAGDAGSDAQELALLRALALAHAKRAG